ALDRRLLGGLDAPRHARMLRRSRDLLLARVRRDDFVEPFGQIERRLSGAGAAIPRPTAFRRQRCHELEQRARIPRPKLGIAGRDAGEVIALGARSLRGHRTTATATPSCVGTMMPSTRGSAAMRRLNS